MPIKSYLAHPFEGQKDTLIVALDALENCEVIPAENKDILIVVTDTQTKQEEDILKTKLEAIESLKMLSMVSGFDTPKKQ